MTDQLVYLSDYQNSVSLYEEPEVLTTTMSSVTSDRLDNLRLTLDATRFYVLRIIASIVVTIGVCGNIVNILVLTKRSMKSSTNYYLSALAAADIFYLLSALTMTFMHYKEFKDVNWYFRYKNICGRVLTDIGCNIGVWLTITFTVERYIGVCYPMKGKVWCTTHKAKRVVAAVCLCAGLLTFPEFFEFKIVSTEVRPNVTGLTRNTSDFGNSSFYHFYHHLNQAIFTFLPLILLLIFNTLLIRTVVKAAKDRRRMTVMTLKTESFSSDRHLRNEQGITITLIIVVVVFLCCQFPQAIHKLYAIYLESYGLLTEQKTILLLIQANYFNLLVMINASVNFALYSACSYEFRRSFRGMLSLSRKTSNQPLAERRTNKSDPVPV